MISDKDDEHFVSVQAVRRNRGLIKAQKPVSKSLFFIRKRARALLVIFA